MIAYFFSAVATIAAVCLSVWLLATGWRKLMAALEDSAWPADNGVRVVIPEACRACGAVGFCHEGCSRLDRWDRGEVA